MSQFIRRNQDHDVISFSSSRPVTGDQVEELNGDYGSMKKYEGDAATPAGNYTPEQNNTSILDHIFNNYSLLPTKYKSKTSHPSSHQDRHPTVNLQESNNDLDIYNSTQEEGEEEESDDHTASLEINSQTFQSALDTYNQPSVTSEMSSKTIHPLGYSAYESDTQYKTIAPQQQDQSSTQSMNIQLPPLSPISGGSAGPLLPPLPNDLLDTPLITITTMTKVVRFLKYLVGRHDYNNPPQRIPDPERQSLLSPITSPDLNDRNPPYQGPAYDLIGKYRQFFILFSVVLLVILLIVLLVTGDSLLLALIFRALLCYLLGDNASRLLGDGFCPIYGWFWPWTWREES